MTRLVLLTLFALASTSLAAQTVFVVRHAERADAVAGGDTMMAADPELSKAGQARAESLAAMLRDAGIAAVFASDTKRAQQTAAPLAKALGLTVQVVPAKDTTALVAKVKGAKGNVLVVGHSNTVPEIVKALGVSTPVTIGDSDYDNLFVVTLGPPPAVVRLHFK